MKICLAALLAAIFLSGCSAADIGTAKTLTVTDAARYVAENHERRRMIRAQQDRLRNRAVDMLEIRGTQAAQDGDWAAALEYWATADQILAAGYPSLATIEMLREGAKDVDEIRSLFRALRDEGDGQ